MNRRNPAEYRLFRTLPIPLKSLLLSPWRYRHLIAAAVSAEFRARFARSRLGGAWMVLHPLAQVAIYAVVLSAVFSSRLPGITNQHAYAIYLLAGMAAWSLFSEVLARAVGVFVENGNLLKKLAFPRILLALNLAASALVGNLLLLAATLAAFAALGHFPSAGILWLPLLTFLNLGFALGLGLVLGVLNVFIRDVGQVVPVIVQFLFWCVPIVYVQDILPEAYRGWLKLNPLYHVVVPYQQVLAYGTAPDTASLAVSAGGALFALAAALALFRRAGAEMTDVL
jgi:lipopolysaccharide transport system permease protein